MCYCKCIFGLLWDPGQKFSQVKAPLTLMILSCIFVTPACSRVQYRCLLVHPSVCPFMSTFDIYVKVSILINFKTKQPSNLAWNISLTSWLRDTCISFFVRLSVHPSIGQHLCRSLTFMSKFDISVKVSILINYKTKQPSNLAWNISLTASLWDIGARFSVRLSVC